MKADMKMEPLKNVVERLTEALEGALMSDAGPKPVVAVMAGDLSAILGALRRSGVSLDAPVGVSSNFRR